MKQFIPSKTLIVLTMGAMLTGCAQDDLRLSEGNTAVTFTA